MFTKISRFLKTVVVASLVLQPLAILQVHAAADTCTWTGAVNNTWSNGGNWSGCDNGGVPESGDSLIFASGASNTNPNVNDIAGLNLDSVQFNGSGYVVSGNAVDLTPTGAQSLSMWGSNNNWAISTTVNGSSATFRSTGTGNAVTGPTTLNLNVGQDFSLSAGPGSDLNMAGSISGSTNYFVTSTSGGTVRLGGANTFTTTNRATLYAHTIICESATCLGDAGNLVELRNNADLRFDTAATFANDIEFYESTATISTQDQTATISGNIAISGAGASAIIEPGTSASLVLNGTMNLGTGTMNFGGNAEVIQNGIISGSGNVISNHALVLSSANTYAGSTLANPGGRIVALNDSSLGTTAGDTYIDSGASLTFESIAGDITIDEDIFVNGAGDTGIDGAIYIYDTSNSVTLTGNITLNGDTTFGNGLAGSSVLRLAGVISGTANMTFTGVTGAAGFDMSGASANTYVGTVTVTGARLFPAKAANVTAITGDLVIAGDGTDDGHVETSFSESIADTSHITLTNNGSSKGVLAIGSGSTETVGYVTGDGDITIGHSAALNVASNSDFTFGGRIGQFSNFVLDQTFFRKTGSGILTLTGSVDKDSFTSAVRPIITVDAGSLVMGSSSNYDEARFTVSNGTVLKGTGVAGVTTVASGGAVNVGNSPGCMTMATLTLNAGAVFTEEIAGTTACTQYDQTTVTGAVDLGSATLNIVLSTTPADGAVFTIVNAGSVTGTFNGLANGATITVNGVQFRVNYSATTVTLTKLGGTLSNTGSNTLFVAAFASIVAAVAISLSRRRHVKFAKS